MSEAAASGLGGSLRRLRKERRLTLAEVSRRSDLPLSTLSKVETGQMSLTFERLLRLASGLGIDVGEIIASSQEGAAAVTARRSITRAGQGRRISTPTYGYEYLCTDLIAKQMGKALKPERVLFAAELPKTRSAKIMRRVIRATHLGKDPGDLSSLDNPGGIKAIAEAS